jgi:hypothetical protein
MKAPPGVVGTACVLALASSCADVQLSVRKTTLATATVECDIAPTLPGPNQIQLRFTVTARCDVDRAEADVLLDKFSLAHDPVKRQLFEGVADSFDSSPFPRPVSGTLLTAELKGTCKGGKRIAGADQCRVP